MLKETMKKMEVTSKTISLNPYFNGTCSKSKKSRFVVISMKVLILILMEHAQRDVDFKGSGMAFHRLS